MNPLLTVARWLDIRPHEYRLLTLSALGAFLVISFVVVARALREAFFLDEFAIELLPYMAILTTAVSLPAVGLFSRLLSRSDPRRVYRNLIIVVGAGVLACWGANTFLQFRGVAMATTIGFYLWTAAGSLLLTSGFWILTSEYFALRDAKRLFGMIGAAGTLGAMVAGLSLSALSAAFGNGAIVLGLVANLVALYLLQHRLPAPGSIHTEASIQGDASMMESLGLVVRDRHLRTLAAIVAAATAASFMIDYQFKEAASLHYQSDEALVGFFGLFYGLTGVLSLALQILVAARLLASGGVAWTLSVLPMVLLVGSTGLLFLPSLIVATLVRGADNSIRKSLHRSVIEYLYVPVPSLLRRKTKAFIDSFVDSSAEGAAALLVLLWVTLLGLPSRSLSLLVIVLAIGFLGLSRSMGAQYFQTLLQRLKEGQQDLGDGLVQTHFVGGDLTMTVTQLDMQTLLSHAGLAASETGAHTPASPAWATANPVEGTLERLAAADPAVVSSVLDEAARWEAEHAEALIRLLARDAFYQRAAKILVGLGNGAVVPLSAELLDEGGDFVVRRRIPQVLTKIPQEEADWALVGGLSARRFEVRYRCAVALAWRRRKRRPSAAGAESRIWEAIRSEVRHERPIWELQRLLDERPSGDEFVDDRVYGRGELSLEHTFRLLALVLDPAPIRTAFHGVVLEDARLKSVSLEYLEQVLPPDVRDRLWPFIGDISEFQRRSTARGVGTVVDDLLKTGATLFVDPAERRKLREALEATDDEEG